LAPGQLPTIELLLTGLYRPWEAVPQPSDSPEWAGILDVGGGFGYWQCNSLDYLRLSERHARARKSDLHTLVLAATEQDLLRKASPDRQDLPAAIANLSWSVSGILVRWSLTALLRELEEQLSSIQDAADRTGRKRSGRAVAELQQQLLRAGLDSQIVVSDIVRYTEDRMWGYDLLDFTRVAARRALGREPTVTLAEWLRQGQAQDGRRVSRMERDLREVLSTNAELTAPSANLRLQWTAIWIAAIAAVIAIVIALWPHQNTSTPTQRPHSVHTVLRSPPTSSSSKASAP
jgi:hypothetical protein